MMRSMERQTVALEPLIYDETTGLPKLPEGYAWEVSVNTYSKYEADPENTALTVQIAKRQVEKMTWVEKMLFMEPKVEWITYDHPYSDRYENCGNDADDLKSAATTLYNEYRNAELDRAKLRKLVGLYPPKSIL